MYSPHTQPPFHSPTAYIEYDIAYVIFSILYIMGDSTHMNNFLKYCKPFPVWIMIYQLYSLRDTYPFIKIIMIGLFFGSLGDIFLLFQSEGAIFFALGAFFFLVGHVMYVPSFVNTARDLSENKVTMRQVLQQQPLFIVIWIILVGFSFWSISFIVASLTPDQSMYQYVLAVYGTCLVMLTMGGFFYFFTTSKLSKTIFNSGVLYMIGSLIFFASDNFLAHGKFDNSFKKVVSQSLNTYFIMITYYVAQFLIGKGTFLIAAHYVEQNNPKQNVITQNEPTITT